MTRSPKIVQYAPNIMEHQKYVKIGVRNLTILQLTTRTTDFFVVSKMSVDLVGFVILVGVGCGLPRLKYVV